MRRLAFAAAVGFIVAVIGYFCAGCAAPQVERRDASVTLSGQIMPGSLGR